MRNQTFCPVWSFSCTYNDNFPLHKVLVSGTWFEQPTCLDVINLGRSSHLELFGWIWTVFVARHLRWTFKVRPLSLHLCFCCGSRGWRSLSHGSAHPLQRTLGLFREQNYKCCQRPPDNLSVTHRSELRGWAILQPAPCTFNVLISITCIAFGYLQAWSFD